MIRSGSLLACCAIAAMSLAGCGRKEAEAKPAPTSVLTKVIEKAPDKTTISLTGDIEARVQSDLSFRVSGRVAKRMVDVGDHVTSGEVLATLDDQEQQSDVTSAKAGVDSAQASVAQTSAAFDRQKTLLSSGFTTKSNYDNAEQAFQAAKATLDARHSDLATAQDQLTYMTLRAPAAGVVTARNIEVGEVVSAAQAAFTVAQDGARDAVFNVYDGLLTAQSSGMPVQLFLPSDPKVATTGTVREVSPSVDAASGSTKVKVALDQTPDAMTLGAVVAGRISAEGAEVMSLPWTALSSLAGKPAVWIVDPQAHTVSPKEIEIDSYRTGTILIRAGLKPGDTVVTVGTQLLRPGEIITPVAMPAGTNSADPAKSVSGDAP